MKKFLQKKIKNEKGLTLVELLAVIVILGIIAAIAVPAIGGIIESSREKATIADAMNTMEAANLFFVSNPDATSVALSEKGDTNGVLIPEFLDTKGNLESATVTKKDSVLTITFKGTAGTKKIDITTGLTKEQLSNTDTVREEFN